MNTVVTFADVVEDKASEGGGDGSGGGGGNGSGDSERGEGGERGEGEAKPTTTCVGQGHERAAWVTSESGSEVREWTVT